MPGYRYEEQPQLLCFGQKFLRNSLKITCTISEQESSENRGSKMGRQRIVLLSPLPMLFTFLE